MAEVVDVAVRTDGNAQRLPGVIFASAYSNDGSFALGFFAKRHDLVAHELRDAARFLLGFKELRSGQGYRPRWAAEVEIDFYDYSSDNRERIRQFISRNHIVLVILTNAGIGTPEIKFLQKLGVKTVNVHADGFDHAQTQPLHIAGAKFLLRSVLRRQIHDLHITHSHGQYKFLRRFAHIPRQHLRTIPHGIDTEYYHPGDRTAACAQLGLDPETVWIMAAAQARPEKRIDRVIDAVRRVKQARPHARIGFFYVGSGMLLAQWEEVARSVLPAKDYRFFGKQSDMRPFYHAASILVHGSFRESFGLVLVEAMASGLPVVATYAHGPAEIIDSGETGFLVARDDWDAFVDAILFYIDHPELRLRHGDIGRRRCLERFTCDREASELAALIRPFLRRSKQINAA
jgi:glycosyltransferase involved in cell wall biosynthesis